MAARDMSWGQSPRHVRFGHGDTDRHLGLVVSELAPGVLSRGDAACGLPLVLRAPLRHGRAELDRLPAAERGSVPALGGRRPGRISLRGQAAAHAARPRRPVPRARRLRSATDSARCASSRRPHATRALSRSSKARCRPTSSSPGICVTSRGPAATGIVRVNDAQARALPLPAPARAAVHRRRSPHGRSGDRRPGLLYIRHEDEPTAPATAARLRELLT